jgi:hypothetical protein
MNKEREEKLHKAIDKLVGYHVGDRVLITSAFTGRTVFTTKTNDGAEFSFDMNIVGNLNKEGTINAIQADTTPLAYHIMVEKGHSGYFYTPDNFRLLGGV